MTKPSDRRTRRANERRGRAALRQQGCRCIRTFRADLPDLPRLPGTIEPGWVEREPGCPLGDRVAALNARGYFPGFVFTGVKDCER